MNRRIHAIFNQEDQVLAATQDCRDRGYEIIDVYTPYPVHGLDKAMGLKPSLLPLACFLLAVIGASAMMLFMVWSSAVDWPINIGGKPLNSLPAFVPVTFETAVLMAGLGTILVLFIRTKLHPFRTPTIQDPRVTNDHFLLAIRQTDADIHPHLAAEMLEKHGAIEVTEVPAGELS
jgi:hypothetical protein